MPEPQLSNSSSSRRQKQPSHHSPGYVSTPAFWDSLSKVWLTKHALREFDRRNSRPHSPGRQSHRPITRNFLTEQRNVRKPISAADFLRNSAPGRWRDVKRFARHGGPGLSDLVGYPEPTPLNRKMSSSRSISHRNHGPSNSRIRTVKRTLVEQSTSGKGKSTTTSNPNDANYQQKLIDDGVFPYGYKYPDGNRPPLPPNWDETCKRLAQRRPSLSPSAFPEEAYQKFEEADADAFNEDAVKDTVLPAMLQAIGASAGAQKNILFTNIDPITDNITQAKPDYYYGAQPEQINPRVCNELSKHIIPSKHAHLPAVPNFFLEAKGPYGSGAAAKRQVCHDGAIGARAMQSLRSYGRSEPVYDNHAYTISATYHEGTLKLYNHWVAQPNGPGTRPEYYMHQLNTWSMAGNKDAFLQGATAFKNALDLTREQRNAAIGYASDVADQTIEDETGKEDGGGSEGEEEEREGGEEEAKEEEEEETEKEAEGTVDDEAEAESSNTKPSFDRGTSQILSTPGEDEEESESSVEGEEESLRLPPAKRPSSSKSHRSHRQKRKTDN
ncbi:hypothetical protein EV356DRAFT_455391 [Viridothelium virens]|uniref:DUF7924 domain-containing protein n=1 Tax=Viridothelium virens TaxID=1048519 RepID=A0A6A6GVM3_VIRVR|nr:hypothetical protein EV356DRAFT_455391 [Viridothelium virens]